jgi:hypothetical protein
MPATSRRGFWNPGSRSGWRREISIGSDFNRFGLAFWSLVDGLKPENAARRSALDELNEWRNAVAHQDFSAAMLRAGRPHLTLAQVRAWRKACHGLALAFDAAMWNHIKTLTGNDPW